MEGVVPLVLWTASFVLTVNAQQKLMRVKKTEDSRKYCSTWGMYHFKTFDDRNFNFEGRCAYDFSMDCHSAFPFFHIIIHRPTGGEGNIVYFTAKIDDVYVVVSPAGILIDGNDFTDYEKKNGIEVKDTCENLEILGNGIKVIWNWGDSLKVELDEQYKKKVCGLCGDYDDNGINDIQWRGLNVSDVLFGNLHKASDPSEDCPDVFDNTQEQGSHKLDDKCKDKRDQCETIMSQMGDCKYKMQSYKIYMDTCTEDLCKCEEKNQTICLCSNLNQFSKACLEAKGHPGMWRRPDFCYISCPNTMEFFECTSPCLNTCSNPTASKLCTELCKEGCSCPPGTVLDDVNNNKKCVKLNLCPCAHNGKIYNPGDSYSAACQKCTCILGQWTCSQVSCSGNCTVKGGSHIQTFDEKEYNFHGNCQYLMSKDADNKFAIIAKIIQCGMTETVTCLNTVYINLERMKIKICYCGNVYINNFLVALPKITDKIAIYKRSAFFVYIETSFGLSVKVQVKPVFQLFISLNSTFQNRTLGLCGNFNGIEGDDLTTISGVVEDAVSDFANSYKIQASCSDVPDYFENPCSKNINKEEYAKHWCSHLVLSQIFAPCHEELDPKPYQKHCIYDACNSENSEEAVCAWLGDYADECRSRSVLLNDWRWRYNICDPGCPESMVFMSNPRQCNFTCNSLAEPDIFCHFMAGPREGCSCPEGTYQTQNEKCVPPEDCPCNYKGRTVPAHQTYKIDEILCKCIRGILECPMADEEIEACIPPMYYYDCSSPNPDTVGSQCQKSCKTQDMECYSNECVIGCVCPNGLVSDDNGGCIPPSECPCVYRGEFHDTESTINVSCNTCTCKNRTWDCTMEHCPKTCTLYGNGHLITFDQARIDISGGCDYILAQDFCPNNNQDGSFQIFIKHILCGHTNTICSLQIRIILLNITIDIYEGRVEEITKHKNGPTDNSYSITLMGQHIVFATEYLTLMYDQKMTANVLLSNTTEGTVCGLCGDNDGRAVNDLTSPWSQGCIHERSRSETLCDTNPEKLAWAQKHCNLINSEVFASCKSLVDPIPFYDTCVEDTCTCSNDIGDCECLCTSIAAYSAACRKHDICIKWRTPSICPVFCDYYNKDGHCVWHYDPCGTPCVKTCLNPNNCQKMEKLEGCYPKCSNERPYFDTENQICVDKLNCSVCTDKLCDEHTGECVCCYLGKTYRNGEPITEMIDGQLCITGYCIEGHLKDIDMACGYFTSQTTALTVTPEALTQTLTKKTATLISEITKTDLSKYIHSALPYTNASTTTPKIYSSTKKVTVSVLSQMSSQPVTRRDSSFLSGKVTESTSTSLISSPYFYAPTTLPSSTTKLSASISTKETTQSPIPMSFPKTTHTTPVKSTYPALVSNTTTISSPYLKERTTLKTKMTVTGTIPLITSKTTKLHTSTQSTIKTVLSKTTPYTTTFQPAKYTVSPPFSKVLTTFKTKVTSTTPTSSTAKLSTFIYTKEFTQSTKQMSLPKTTHTTPVEWTHSPIISKTTTISPLYPKGSTSLKTKMTVTGTTPLTTSETTKLRTSTQSTIQTVLSKTTPQTTTFQHVTSKSTIFPPYSKAPTTVETKVTSTIPKKSSTAKQSTSISKKETTSFTKQISLPKTTYTTMVKSTYPALTSKTTTISSPYPKGSTSLKTKMTVTGTTPLKTSETTKLRTSSTQSTIQTILLKTTPQMSTFQHVPSKFTILPPYSKAPTTVKTKVTSTTTTSSIAKQSTSISTKENTPFIKQISLRKTTHTTPVRSTYPALISKTTTISSLYPKGSTSLKPKMTMTSTTPLTTSETTKLHTSTQSTIQTVLSKTTPHTTIFQHATSKSTMLPPYSKVPTTFKTKVTITTPTTSSTAKLSTYISTKETTPLTKQISLPKTTHTTPVKSTYPALISKTTYIPSQYSKASTTLKTKITVTGTIPLITSKTTKLRTSTESTIKTVHSKTTPYTTTFQHITLKSTVSPPILKAHTTLKTKVTSTTPTSSASNLSTSISTKESTQFIKQISLPKTTHTTPVKSTYPALVSNTTTISSLYPKRSTTLKNKMTVTGTTTLITLKTTKLHTSTQSTVKTVLSKTTPHTTTFEHASSKSTVLPAYSKTPKTLKTKVTSVTPTSSSTARLSTYISTKATTPFIEQMSLPKTTQTTPVKSTYPALISKSIPLSSSYPKGSTTLKTKMTMTGTSPLPRSKTTKLHTSTHSTIQAVLSKTTPHTTTLQQVTSKSTMLPPYSKAPTTFKTKVTSTTPTTSSKAKLSISISTIETTPFTEQISLPKTTRTTPVKSTYPALISKTTPISSSYPKGITTLKTKTTMTGTIPLITSKTTKLHTSTKSTIQAVLSKTIPQTTTLQHVISKSTMLPPYSKSPTTFKTKATSTALTSSGTAKLSTSISKKETAPFTKQISLLKTVHTIPVKSTYTALISNTSTIYSPYSKASTTLKTEMTLTGTIPLITSTTTKVLTSTESPIKTVLSKTTPNTTTFQQVTSKSTVLPPFSKAPTTFKTKVTSTTPTTSSTGKLTTSISTKETTQSTKHMSLPKTTHTTPVKSTYPALISNTSTIYSPYSKASTTLKTEMTVTGTIPLITSKTTKVFTSTESTIKTVLSKTTPNITTFQQVTSKSTVSPPFSKAPTTFKTKVTSTTPTTSSTGKLTTSISTKETTQSTKHMSLPKTTHTTPVKSTYPALISNTSTIYSPYSKASTTLKTEMTVTGTIPLITSKTTKVFTSTESTIKTVLSKTTPNITTFQQVTSKSTVSPPFSKAPTTFKTKVTSTTPTTSSTGKLTTSISTKETTQSTKHMSLPKTTHTTPVKATYPALISNTTTVSSSYPKGSTTLKTKSTVTGTIPLITSKTSKLHTSIQSTIQTVLSKTTPHTITFKHATFKSTVLPLYSKAPTTFKTKVASTTPTTSSTGMLTTSISTKESTPLTKQISFPKTTHTTPVKSTYPAVISKTTTIYSPYSKLTTSLKAKMTMTGTTPLSPSETTKLHISTQSTIKTVVSKSPHTTTFQRETSKSTISPPYSKTPTTLKTKISSVSPSIFSDIFANTLETSTSMKKTTQSTTQKTLSRTSHTKPIKYSTTSSALISKTTFMSPPHSKSPTTVKTKMTSFSPRIFSDVFANTLATFSTSKTAKLHTSTQSTIKEFPYKSTPLTTTFLHITSKHTTTKYPTITEKTSTMSGKTTKIATTGKKSTRRETEETHYRTFSVPTTVGDQCLLMSEPMNITKGECSTLQAVPMNYCTGHCSTSSMYSHDRGSMMRSCFCCLDTEGSTRTVQLTCLDGSTLPYTYYLIKSCSCVAMTCGKPEDTTLRPVT